MKLEEQLQLLTEQNKWQLELIDLLEKRVKLLEDQSKLLQEQLHLLLKLIPLNTNMELIPALKKLLK